MDIDAALASLAAMSVLEISNLAVTFDTPDGEVHACRKFPSPLGNIMENSLDQIYRSGAARRYRLGPAACSSCAIRPVCGGCLAVSHSHGLDIFTEKDPYCFRDLPDSFC